MTEPSTVYVIHIATTADKLWDALTSVEALKQYWGRIESQWTIGSKVAEVDEIGKSLWEGRVLRNEQPHILSYSFGISGSQAPTTVTFEISLPKSKLAPNTQVVQLRLMQTGFQDEGALFAECEQAWPEILSSLKSFLETGRPLGFAWKQSSSVA